MSFFLCSGSSSSRPCCANCVGWWCTAPSLLCPGSQPSSAHTWALSCVPLLTQPFHVHPVSVVLSSPSSRTFLDVGHLHVAPGIAVSRSAQVPPCQHSPENSVVISFGSWTLGRPTVCVDMGALVLTVRANPFPPMPCSWPGALASVSGGWCGSFCAV